jgi:hypothetical protein
MNSTERACLSRVRMLALVAMTRVGGTPAPWQLRRAIEPVLGDLADELATAADRVARASRPRSCRPSTVDSGTKKPSHRGA